MRRIGVEIGERGMFIGGQWRQSSSGETIKSVNPATEEVIGGFPAADANDVELAVQAGDYAGTEWDAFGWQRRAQCLESLAQKIESHAEEIAMLDTKDCGAPISGMRADVSSAVRELRYFGGLGGELKGTFLPPERNRISWTQREPFGVVARIVPFNHPFKFAAGKVAAPLIAGNSVVLKPSEETSLSALALAELSEGILPPGVLNVVTGLGTIAGSALVKHESVQRIAFTGGSVAGRAILHDAVDGIKDVSLELGGKNPMIVFPDVDPMGAAKGAVGAMNLRRSAGQSCQSSSRIFVHSDVLQPFLDALVEECNSLIVGDPQDEMTDLGPLAYRRHFERVMSFVEAGQEQGASLLAGGVPPTSQTRGFFLQPTIFSSVDVSMSIAREEIFGPVISVLEWSDYEDMISACNELEFGLTANIWTNNLSLAHITARRIDAGLVWINGSGGRPLGTPFGGFKQSGLGKDGSLDEVMSFTRSKAIVANFLR